MTNLAQNLHAAAERHGDRLAVRLDEHALTYSQIADAAARVATLLTEGGVTVVPMNPLLSEREVAYYLTDS